MALARMNKHFTTSEVFILGEGQDVVLLLSAAARWRLRGLHRDDPGLKPAARACRGVTDRFRDSKTYVMRHAFSQS
jgi:hypothetical protein